MSKSKDEEELSKDTRPLEADQLSDDELLIIDGIEQRLGGAQNTDLEEKPHGRDLYLATTQNRHPRVLLLDGGRGTGKTSLLLTLVERWHRLASGKDNAKTKAWNDRLKKLCKSVDESVVERLKKGPNYISVVRILDFDPLPPEMPVIAGIVESWRLLAEKYDELSNLPEDYEGEEDGPLMDHWHRLFRMAAVGWSAVSNAKGLIEQVLDREDQVKDWQNLDKHWRSFVDKAIERGKRLKDLDRLDKNPVFVIIVDDCDLEVGRIRELLPALRTLYHPRVFFLVAADQPHMIDMLTLDFFGRQSKLAWHRSATEAPAIDLATNDPWASELAYSAFEKVFPKMNRWKLKRLSLLEFLAFPGQVDDLPKSDEGASVSSEEGAAGEGEENPNFFALLNRIEKAPTSLETEDQERRANLFCNLPGRFTASNYPGL